MTRIIRLYVPEDIADTLLGAINCYEDCVHGRRDLVEECWFLEDDATATGGSMINGVERLQASVGEALRRELKHMAATNPRLQDLLHRAKMMRKYGEPT